MSVNKKKSGITVYALVVYNFKAERPDELEAKAGEALIVIAQSNLEWIVAKPIGRLGGPGLIPVSFVEIREMATGEALSDAHDAVKRAGVPQVEEWKKMTTEYNNSSIMLGKLDGTVASGTQFTLNQRGRMSIRNGILDVCPRGANTQGYYSISESRAGAYSQGHAQQAKTAQPSARNRLLAPVSASVTGHYFDHDNDWYVIEAKIEDGTHWKLSRLYRDFYDLQIALLTQFEEEAGHKQKARTLPFMPGPVSQVTDAISEGRRKDLDDYIKKLVAMPPHIAQCPLVCKLFSPRPGDFEIGPNAVEHAQRLSVQDISSTDSRQSFHARISASATGHAPPNVVPSTRPPDQRRRLSLLRRNSFVSQSRTILQIPLVTRQTSSQRQASNNDVNDTMEVEVYFQDDIIDIWVPIDVNFHQLQVTLRDQLKVTHDMMVQYRDESINDFVDMLSDHDLDVALQRNSKLTLRVSVA